MKKHVVTLSLHLYADTEEEAVASFISAMGAFGGAGFDYLVYDPDKDGDDPTLIRGLDAYNSTLNENPLESEPDWPGEGDEQRDERVEDVRSDLLNDIPEDDNEDDEEE